MKIMFLFTQADNGNKEVIIDIDKISAIVPVQATDFEDATEIHMDNGDKFTVKDDVTDIVDAIVEAKNDDNTSSGFFRINEDCKLEYLG